MLKFVKDIGNISWHGNVASPFLVIPVQRHP
jgi:hypothetical protein